MRNKTAEIADEILNNDIDSFFITESWLSGEIDENFIITQTYENSQHFHHDSHPRNFEKGGRLAVIFKRELNLISLSSSCTPDFEAAFFSMNEGRLKICILYRPPSVSFKTFSEFLYERIPPLSMESDLIFLGDFNLPQSVALESFFDETLLTQLIEESTHQGGNTLDLLVTNQRTAISTTEIRNVNYSDHKMIRFNLSRGKELIRHQRHEFIKS